MLERVLFPMEGESTFRRAFGYAAHLGERTGAPVTVLTIVEQAEARDEATVMLDGLLDEHTSQPVLSREHRDVIRGLARVVYGRDIYIGWCRR